MKTASAMPAVRGTGSAQVGVTGAVNVLFRDLTLQFLLVSLALHACVNRTDPLPSWNNGASKAAIVGFVETVTANGGAGYVPPAERVAVFDNDGTLWAEQPIPVQLAFAFDRVRTLAPEHPEWRDAQPFRAVLDNDLAGLLAGGEQAADDLFGRNAGGRFALIVRHTDAGREWAYDRQSSSGRLDHALDEARSKGWTVVDMARDWRVIYP